MSIRTPFSSAPPIAYLAIVAAGGLCACGVQADDAPLDQSPNDEVSDGETVDNAAPPSSDSQGSGGVSFHSGNDGIVSSGGMTAQGSGGAVTGGSGSEGPDPNCERGIANNAMTACCPAACGFCGGVGCEDNPGGEAACCAGAIGNSGISCEHSGAPCSLWPDDSGMGSGGTSDSGGGSGSGGSGSGECELDTPVAGLPSYDFTMHNVLTKRMERSDFCDADKWYSEWLDSQGNPVQEFSLHKGDDMADFVPGGRSHQRCEFEDGLWVTKGQNDWIEWEGRMLINKHPENTITIGQMFGPNGPDARVEIRENGSIGVGSLKCSDTNVTMSASDMVGKSFKIRMRTNGSRVEVYYNGSKEVDCPTNGNNGQKWHFRWGVYSNVIPQEDTPLTNTVSELVVSD